MGVANVAVLSLVIISDAINKFLHRTELNWIEEPGTRRESHWSVTSMTGKRGSILQTPTLKADALPLGHRGASCTARVTHPEEGVGRPALPGSVSYVSLLGQVLHALYGRHHPLHRQKGRQVGRVGGDDDQGEEPPDASHDPGGHSPGVHVRPLLHQRAHGEPETVGQVERVLHLVRVRVAGVRVIPLVRAEAGQHEDGEADEQVGPDDVQPDLHGQGVEEGEEARLLAARDLEEDGDAQVEEGLGEVDYLLPHVVDGEGRHGQVRSLESTHQSVPTSSPKMEYDCFIKSKTG